MTKPPTLTIAFGPPQINEETELQLALNDAKMSTRCKLKLPFLLKQIPLILRALNARQYPDYPFRQRLFKPGDDIQQMTAQLQELGLWDGNDESGAIAEDVHSRVGRLLGTALLTDQTREYLNKLYDAAIQTSCGEIILSFDLKTIALAALPWEVTHDGPQPILLTKGVRLNCIRIFNFNHTQPTYHCASKRLRALTIAPRVQMNDAGYAFEQLARSRMQEALRNFPVDIEVLPLATMEGLHNRLEQGPDVDILDYYGHGSFTEKGGSLFFEDRLGGRDAVVASRLAALPKLP
jgi:hypothetical protein